MTIPITMPQLGESVVKGTIIRWLKVPGDSIETYEPLVEIETDKVVTEVPAPQSGVLLQIVRSAGETAEVGAVLAYLGESGEAIPDDSVSTKGAVSSPTEAVNAKPRRFTPIVLRLAEEHNISLEMLRSVQTSPHVTSVFEVDMSRVVAPSNPYDAKELLKAAIRDPDPVVYFEFKATYRTIEGEVADDDYVVPIGVAEIKCAGQDLTLLTYGMMLHESLKTAETLAGEGVNIEVIDLRTLLPLDKETILASVRKTSKVLIVHEANKTAGPGTELSAIISEEAFEYLDGPITRVTGPDVPAMPFAPTLESAFMPNATKIADAARELNAY